MPTFTTNFAPPATPAGLTILANIALSRIELDWTGTALGPDFGGYRVYRRRPAETDFILLAQIASETESNYLDVYAPLGELLEYRVTVSNLFDESLPAEAAAALDTARWWIVVPGDAELTFELRYVVDHDEEWPLEEEVFRPLGRDRAVVQQGELTGSEGTIGMTILASDPTMLPLLRRAATPAGTIAELLIKSPTGDVYVSALGSVKRKRIPGGASRVMFPYVEVG